MCICVLHVFTDPAQTEIIRLVGPTYHLVFREFEDAGVSRRMRGIFEDEEGMNVAALELALNAFERSGDSASQNNRVCALSMLIWLFSVQPVLMETEEDVQALQAV